MKTIQLTKGKFAIVDDEDYPQLVRHCWYAQEAGNGVWYAMRRANVDGKSKNVSMHRELLNPEHGKIADHANRNCLDNRRSNLRQASRTQNQANRTANKKNASGFKCVTKYRDKFRARINFEGKTRHIGIFSTAKEAHAAYVEAAIQVFGEFARGV